jgi:predicted nuclease of restriction endonuclease-like (RecB) superfamily
MKQFYETYCDNEFLSPLVREISWTNNLVILSKTTNVQEREFYLRLSITEKYSSRELERQIDSGLYERTISDKQFLSAVLREIHPKAENTFRDSYVLDFLSLPKHHSEKDFRKAIIQNLKQFVIEFGKDFAFVGEEYRLQVGNKDFYVDLLFYHRELQCLVAFDLKITDFKPEYMGKMEFYLEALDNDVKKEHEKPSVGIILCKNHDSQVVQYALNRSVSPTMIAKYETQLIDKKLLEQKLDEFFTLEEPRVEYKII